MSTSTFSLTGVLPAVDAPASTIGKVYGAIVPVTIGYALYEAGMPSDAAEWAVAVVLLLVAVGFAMNLFTVQFAATAAPAA